MEKHKYWFIKLQFKTEYHIKIINGETTVEASESQEVAKPQMLTI